MFLTLRSKEKLIVDPSKTGEMDLKATCYVYVLRLRSLLLKQPFVETLMCHCALCHCSERGF